MNELLGLYSIYPKKNMTTPLRYKRPLMPLMDNPLKYPTLYRKLIGKLNFLVHTHPDLSYVIQHIIQFN